MIGSVDLHAGLNDRIWSLIKNQGVTLQPKSRLIHRNANIDTCGREKGKMIKFEFSRVRDSQYFKALRGRDYIITDIIFSNKN